MNDEILMVQTVSDGLFIEFSESGFCYFSTQFLVDSIGRESNQVFLHQASAATSDVEIQIETLLQHGAHPTDIAQAS